MYRISVPKFYFFHVSSQDVFRDYAELTDSSSSPHAQCHRCISNSIAAINYKEEYSDFLSKHK